MRISTKIILLVGLSTLVFSDETMCFKKNHTDLETIESVKLDGGLCAGTNSQMDMKRNGWHIKNIEIKNDYYVYIFKKENEIIANTENISKEKLKAEIITEINTKKQEEIKEVKKQAKLIASSKGENIYLKKCSSCHGEEGEKRISNAKALNNIDLEQFQFAINGYKIGSYNLGKASEMRSYSIGITSTDVTNIYKYLQKINKKN